MAQLNAAPSRNELRVLSAAGFAGFFGIWWAVAASGLLPTRVLP